MYNVTIIISNDNITYKCVSKILNNFANRLAKGPAIIKPIMLVKNITVIREFIKSLLNDKGPNKKP